MPPEENKTQKTPEVEIPTEVQPVESASQETETKKEIPTEVIPEVEENLETIPETETPTEQEVPTQTQTTEQEPITPTEPTFTPQQPQTQPKPTQQPQQPQPQIQTKIVYQIPPNFIQNLLIKARAKIQERKRKKLDKVMTLFEAKPQITNKNIQKLLRISSATATRYLDILESENRIKQVGNTGKSVFYTKI